MLHGGSGLSSMVAARAAADQLPAAWHEVVGSSVAKLTPIE
jgi:hypothetical protein